MKYLICLILISQQYVLNHAYGDNTNLWEIGKSDAPRVTVTETVVRNALPDSFLGLNINYRKFQEHLWDVDNHALKSGIDSKLKKFGNIWYRYPGGIVANSFDWTQAIGEVAKRGAQKTPYNEKSEKVIFGLDEYLQMLDRYGASGFYVLNLVGNDPLKPMMEFDKAQVAEKNKRLAEYILQNGPQQSPVHYYQLGNELDRFNYEWIPEKYVERSAATIEAIKEVDEDAKFVAFLRDFKWTYKADPSLGVSHYDDFMRQVLDGLPMVSDYSLHHYSDGERQDGKARDVPFWLKLMQRSIDTYKKIRNAPPGIWITEHARQKSSNKPGSDGTNFYANNLNGAITTANYLTALAQVAEVKGTFRHGLNAGPWQLFDYIYKHNDLRPLPIYWAMRMLRAMPLSTVLESRNTSSQLAMYQGGYDTRAVAFTNENRDQLGLWAINRYTKPLDIEIEYSAFADRQMDFCHFSMAGKEGVDPDDYDLEPVFNLSPRIDEIKFSVPGIATVRLPPSSVSTLIFGEKISCQPID